MTRLVVMLVKLISGANVRWKGCLPEQLQRVYFANHTSHLDAVVVWASLPAEVRKLTRPVAARDYWEKGPLRPYLARNVFNSVLIDREKISAHDSPIDHLVETLGQGFSLIIFPEGTRSLDDHIGVFKSGIYHLAKRRPDVEFVPVFIENLNRVLPKGEFLAVPLMSSISFGTPMHLIDGESKQAFLERARTAVVNLQNL
ncbi:MAG TPA: lysophospholipid acyltransferase family protein [Verrucomicrobiae bacterium]|nr:lysophospholipid acyltransferase family protein [Verrucomicrobiae bacterium]